MPLSLHIESLSYQFNTDSEPLFDKLSIQLTANSWTCLLGKSGCGKTTLLKLIAGFIQSDDKHSLQGSIYASDQVKSITNFHANIAYMGQQDLLLPWLSVLHNVCLESYLKTGKLSQTQQNKAKHLLEQIGMIKDCHLLPKQLSGGMRQRVALARTLMQDKSIVLMDEPFSAVDAVTRYQLQTLSCQLLKSKTVLFVTHDPQEALRLADRIIIMQQTPAKLIDFTFNKKQSAPRNIDANLVDDQANLFNALGD